MPPQSPFVERRKNPPQTAEHYIDCQNAIRQHFDERFDGLERLIRAAFPDGDVEAHRRVHEGYIKNANDRADLWKAVREKTVSGGIYAALGLLIMAAIESFKAWVKS